MKPTLLDAIDISEEVDLRFPFAAEVELGETIAGIDLVCAVSAGTDPTPSESLVGMPLIIPVTSEVLQRVAGRVDAVAYIYKCVATLSSGRKLTRLSILPVRDYLNGSS